MLLMPPSSNPDLEFNTHLNKFSPTCESMGMRVSVIVGLEIRWGLMRMLGEQ